MVVPEKLLMKKIKKREKIKKQLVAGQALTKSSTHVARKWNFIAFNSVVY